MPVGQLYLKGSTGAWNSPGRLSIGSSGGPAFVEFTPGTVCPIGTLDVLRGETLPAGATAVRNVGIQPTVLLTPLMGNLTLSSGQIVAALDVFGSVTTAGSLASPPSVKNCKIRGVGGTTTDSGMVLGHSYDMSGTVFEWCQFDATGNESGWLNGLSGGNFTVKYSEIMRAVDGVHLTGQGGPVNVIACRIYNGYYESVWNDSTSSIRTTTFTDSGGKVWTPPFADQAGSGDVHADGIQVAGSGLSSPHLIQGNYIGGANPAGRPPNDPALDPTVSGDWAAIQLWDAALPHKNSAIILSCLSTNPIGVTVDSNWLHGGAAVLSASTNGSDLGAGVTGTNNRFIRAGSTGFALHVQTGHAGTFTGNVWDDDNSAVTRTSF